MKNVWGWLGLIFSAAATAVISQLLTDKVTTKAVEGYLEDHMKGDSEEDER